MLPSPDVLCVVIDKEVPEEEMDKALAERQASWIVPARYEQCPLASILFTPSIYFVSTRQRKWNQPLTGLRNGDEASVNEAWQGGKGIPLSVASRLEIISFDQKPLYSSCFCQRQKFVSTAHFNE